MLIQDKKNKYYQQRRHLYIEEKLSKVRTKYSQLYRKRNQKAEHLETPTKSRSTCLLETLGQRKTVKAQVMQPSNSYKFYEHQIKRTIINQLQNEQSDLLQLYQQVKQIQSSFSVDKAALTASDLNFFFSHMTSFLLPKMQITQADRRLRMEDQLHSIRIEIRYYFFLVFLQAFRKHLGSCEENLLCEISYYACKSLENNEESLSSLAKDFLLFLFQSSPHLLLFQLSQKQREQQFLLVIQHRNAVLNVLEEIISSLGIGKISQDERSQPYMRSDLNILQSQYNSVQFQLALVILRNIGQQSIEAVLNNGLFQSIIGTGYEQLIMLCEKKLSQSL